MRKGQQKLISRLKDAGVSGDIIAEFSECRDPVRTLDKYTTQLCDNPGASFEDVRRCISDNFGFSLAGNKYMFTSFRFDRIFIRVKRSYHDRLVYAESLPCGPGDIPREIPVWLYSFGMEPADIDDCINAYYSSRSGKILKQYDIDCEEQNCGNLIILLGYAPERRHDNECAWDETHRIFDAVGYLYSLGTDVGCLKRLIPYMADYEKGLLERHAVKNGAFAAPGGTVHSRHPGLISSINDDDESDPVLHAEPAGAVRAQRKENLPGLMELVYYNRTAPERLPAVFRRRLYGEKAYVDVSGAFKDGFGIYGGMEISRCDISDEKLDALKNAAHVSGYAIVVPCAYARSVTYNRMDAGFMVRFRYSSQLYVETYGRISPAAQKASDVTMIFYDDGASFITYRPVGKRPSKVRPLSIQDIANMYGQYGEVCREFFEKIMSKEAGTALYDVWMEMQRYDGHISLPPLKYDDCLGLGTKNDIVSLYKNTFRANFNKHPLSAFYMVKTALPLFCEEDREKICEYFRQGKFDDEQYSMYGSRQEKKYDCAAMILMMVNIKEPDERTGGCYTDIVDYVEQQHRLGHKLKLKRSFLKMMDEHVRQAQEEAEAEADYTVIKMPERSVFAPLRKMLPDDFEWITDTERLRDEGKNMHHCVATYGGRISCDECAIYSLVYHKEGSKYDGRRYTIEFVKDDHYDDLFTIRQVQAECDRGCPEEVYEYIRSFIRDEKMETVWEAV